MSTDELVAWLTNQLDADEWWAREASRRGDHQTPSGEHWQWECTTTDLPVTIDPMLGEYVEGHDHSSVSLRSVEDYPSSVGPLPHFVINHAEELEPTVAGHIARHDPARVLAEVDAKRRILALHSEPHECPRIATYTGISETYTDYVTANECPTVRLLALPYAGRDGYLDNGRPQ